VWVSRREVEGRRDQSEEKVGLGDGLSDRPVLLLRRR
jgi:hypothetical protein